MIHPDYLTIDVAREPNCSAESLDAISDTIESLQARLGRVGLGDNSSLYEFHQGRYPQDLNLTNFVWSYQTADMHVLLTGRPLGETALGSTIGSTWIKPSNYPIDARHALVLDQQQDMIKITTIHEIGHMLDCGHCRKKDCIMHESTTNELADRYRKNGHAILFCDSCLEYVGTIASQLYWRRSFALNTLHSDILVPTAAYTQASEL